MSSGAPIEELAGATAVVTGAGSGIGRSLALEWAAAGMDVVVADVEVEAAERVAAEVEGAGRKSLAVRCDVSDPQSVAALAALTGERFGAVRMLCNNAGVFLDKPLLECDQADWRRVFAVNVFGIVSCVDAFLPAIRAHGARSHIVNTASDAGVLNQLPGHGDEEDEASGVPWGVYQASKHAVVSYTEQLANALRRTPVEVAVLCPSPVATPMTGMHGIEPERVAELTRAAIEKGRFYIFTEQSPRAAVERRCRDIVQELGS